MPETATQHHDSETTTHTVQVQVTLTIEVDVEASSEEEAVRLAEGFELGANILTGRIPLTGDRDNQWVEFDQTTKVVEVTS